MRKKSEKRQVVLTRKAHRGHTVLLFCPKCEGLEWEELSRADKNCKCRRKPRKIKVDIEGVEYKSFETAGKALGLPSSTLLNRYRRGLRGRDLLKNSYGIVILGTEYQNFSAASKKFGVNSVTLRDRYNRGLRDNDLVAPPRRKNICIQVRGKKFSSVRALADHFGMSYGALSARYLHGIRGEDLLANVETTARIPISILGKKFDCLADAARHFGLGKSTVARRYREGLRDEALISTTKKKGKANDAKPKK